jgi:hypothetical protein
MREISDQEKKIIEKILGDGFTLEKLLGNIMNDTIVIINRSQNTAQLIRKKNSEYGKSDISDQFVRYWIDRLLFISTLIKLLTYLEDNGYIITHLISNVNDFEYSIGNSKLRQDVRNNSISTVTYDFDDEFIIKQLTRYIYRIIKPTESLKVYVKNGYKTWDQVRFEKNYKVAVIAITISLFIGISSLLISLISLNRSITINDSQFKEISNKLENIEQSKKTVHIPVDSLVTISDSLKIK